MAFTAVQYLGFLRKENNNESKFFCAGCGDQRSRRVAADLSPTPTYTGAPLLLPSFRLEENPTHCLIMPLGRIQSEKKEHVSSCRSLQRTQVDLSAHYRPGLLFSLLHRGRHRTIQLQLSLWLVFTLYLYHSISGTPAIIKVYAYSIQQSSISLYSVLGFPFR